MADLAISIFVDPHERLSKAAYGGRTSSEAQCAPWNNVQNVHQAYGVFAPLRVLSWSVISKLSMTNSKDRKVKTL